MCFVQQFYFFTGSSVPPSSDWKFVSTLIKPETPPILTSPENPLIRLTNPFRPGVVPTSKRTQNYGFRYLQNPSKNHK